MLNTLAPLVAASVLLALSVLFLTTSAMTQQPKASANHILLGRLVGEWKMAIEVFSSPGKSMPSVGRATGRARLGNRFVRLDIEMTMLGRQMNHEVTLGHDDFKKQFDFTWLSDQSTASNHATGKVEKHGDDHVLTFKGIMHDAMAGKRPVRHVFELKADASIVFTTFDTLPSGEEFKVMVMQMTRDPR